MDEGKEAEKAITKTSTTTTLTGGVVAAVDWLELPEHLTSLIMRKLTSITDYVRFGAVCTKWLSILLTDVQDSPKFFPPQPPLLMVPTPPSSNMKKNNNKKNKKKSINTISCSFYKVTDGKIYNRLQLTMPRNRYVRGSAYGWLITIDADDLFFSIQLISPFFYPNTSTKVINLPPLTAYPTHENPEDLYYIHLRKVILSANPISNPNDFIVMAIFSEFQTLAFCKPGDKAWTPITDNMKGLFRDIIYYEDKFYALHSSGTIVICNVAKRLTTTYALPPMTDFISRKKYLVASVGELFQVQRCVASGNGDTTGFKVFKLQRREEEAVEWVEVKDLCNCVFFVGDNASMSISASDFVGCKPNCIYYTDDNIENYFLDEECGRRGPHDMGVFNVENEGFEKHYPTDVNIRIWPAPIWIEPTLPRGIRHLKRLGNA